MWQKLPQITRGCIFGTLIQVVLIQLKLDVNNSFSFLLHKFLNVDTLQGEAVHLVFIRGSQWKHTFYIHKKMYFSACYRWCKTGGISNNTEWRTLSLCRRRFPVSCSCCLARWCSYRRLWLRRGEEIPLHHVHPSHPDHSSFLQPHPLPPLHHSKTQTCLRKLDGLFPEKIPFQILSPCYHSLTNWSTSCYFFLSNNSTVTVCRSLLVGFVLFVDNNKTWKIQLSGY